MRKLTQSTGYARMRAVMGVLYTAFGITILVRTLPKFLNHPSAAFALSATALSAALIGLGVLRFRDALARLRSDAS